MAESPPHVVVTTTGVKTDFSDPPVRSERPPAPPDTPRAAEPAQSAQSDEEGSDDRPGD